MRPHPKLRSTGPNVWIRQDYVPTRDELAWLVSHAGISVCEEMATHAPADTPAAIARWRERLNAERVSAAWHQVVWRRAAAVKFTLASRMLMDRVSLEQATDETIARHKARRFSGYDSVADLCCGMGGDALALGAVAAVSAVDLSAIRAMMAGHNAQAYGASIDTRVGDVLHTRPPAAAMHLDPDRRATGPRTARIEEYSPDLAAMHDLVKHYKHAAIKTSPGADFVELPFGAEVELISHRGECKQAVLWTGDLAQVHRRATVLPEGEYLTAATEAELIWPEPVPLEEGKYLFEPDPAVIRANLVGPLARRFDLAPVDPHIVYLVGSQPVHNPMFACFEILESFAWSQGAARELLAKYEVGKLEVKTRGFAGAPEEVLRKLKPRGPNSAVLLLTRLVERPTAILARRIADRG